MFLCSAFAAVVAAYAERFTALVGRPMTAGDATRRVIAARAMIQARISLEGGRGALLECGAFARAVGSVGRALPSHGRGHRFESCTAHHSDSTTHCSLPTVTIRKPLARHAPRWRNGRRAAFRAQCPQGRAGSNPALGTTHRTAPNALVAQQIERSPVARDRHVRYCSRTRL